MEDASSSRASQERSNEHPLQKTMGKIHKFVSQIKKSVEFSERVLFECRNKFDEIDSQISDVGSVSILILPPCIRVSKNHSKLLMLLKITSGLLQYFLFNFFMKYFTIVNIFCTFFFL